MLTRALISVHDKSGIVELAQALHKAGVEIVSTGSTAKTIVAAGIPVTSVSDVTEFPESLDGRVKTLHPKIHAGILANQDLEKHRSELEELGIAPFQLVVVNLYPFTETVRSGASVKECIEQIDIGGAALIRAAAKNHESVNVVVSPSRYNELINSLPQGFSLESRQELAVEAFRLTADYDIAVASWMGNVLTSTPEGFPTWMAASWNRRAMLRYGENPHQPAALYESTWGGMGVAGAEKIHGKEMSFNNYLDADAAWRAAWDHQEPTVAIIKHTNPCGIASGSDIEVAYLKALECDPLSAYGGVIASNSQISEAMAKQCIKTFVEVIIAPSYEESALSILKTKTDIRILRCEPRVNGGFDGRAILGGELLQIADAYQSEGDDVKSWRCVSGQPVDQRTLEDLKFAWRTLRSVKSNAIVLARDLATIGIGMGQVNRVDSAKLAIARAGENLAGSVGASDGFFPFADGLKVLIDAGVSALVQPGGSIRDEEVIAMAAQFGITMYFTGARHFTH